MKRRKHNRKHLRVIIRRYKYHGNNNQIAEEIGYSSGYINQICSKPALKGHIKWLTRKYGRPGYVPPVEYLLEQPPQKPEPKLKKILDRHPGMRAYMQNTSQEQMYQDLIIRINSNILWNKARLLPWHKKQLLLHLLRYTNHRRSEDLEWLEKYAKTHGLEPFKTGGPVAR